MKYQLVGKLSVGLVREGASQQETNRAVTIYFLPFISYYIFLLFSFFPFFLEITFSEILPFTTNVFTRTPARKCSFIPQNFFLYYFLNAEILINEIVSVSHMQFSAENIGVFFPNYSNKLKVNKKVYFRKNTKLPIRQRNSQ